MFVAMLLVWDTGRTAFASDEGTHGWLDWLAIAFIAYGAIGVLVLVPKLFAPRAFREGADPERVRLQLSSMRLAIAVAPFLVSFALVGAGADQWVATVGLVASTLLLVAYVRAARSQSPA
jgi:hypothetical protein